MQPAITNVSKPPVTTLSFDTRVFVGKAQIRRNVGHSTTLYVEDTIADRELSVNVQSSESVSELGSTIRGLYLQTDYPLKVTLNGTLVLQVAKLLVIDIPITTIVMENSDEHYTAAVKLTYGYTKNAEVPLR